MRTQLDAAWMQYNDAEVEAAESLVRASIDTLGCQAQVVPADDLIDLYRLDALTSITRNDTQGAVYATLRAVAVRHEGAVPPDMFGPYLIELYDSWSARLSASLITVQVDGGGVVWVDGRELQAPSSLAVAQGEHLVQIDAGGPLRSEVLDIGADHVVVTGIPGPSPEPLPVPEPEPVVPPGPVAVAPMPAPVPPETTPTPPPESSQRRRRRPLWAFGGAALTGAGAGFAIGSAFISEKNFLADPYQGQGAQRTEAIDRDARAIRIAYATGYGLAGASVGLLGFGVVGLPASGSPAFGWRARW